MIKTKTLVKALAFATASAIAGVATAATQGVSDSEVVVGSLNDLSGPFAAFGAPATKAAQLYFDEVNAAGGVHGRTIRFVVEDHGYQGQKQCRPSTNWLIVTRYSQCCCRSVHRIILLLLKCLIRKAYPT